MTGWCEVSPRARQNSGQNPVLLQCSGSVVQWVQVILLSLEDSIYRGGLGSYSSQGFPPQSKFQIMLTTSTDLKTHPTTTVRNHFRFLGYMASCTYVVWLTRLCVKVTKLAKVRILPRLDMLIQVPAEVIASFNCWMDPTNLCMGVPLVSPLSALTLVTDTSSLGWEANLGNLRTQDLWLPQDLVLHINVVELRAIHLSCQVFSLTLRERLYKLSWKMLQQCSMEDAAADREEPVRKPSPSRGKYILRSFVLPV